MSDTATQARRCEICGVKPRAECANTIKPGEPLPGRRFHHARATGLTPAEKESRRNDACY